MQFYCSEQMQNRELNTCKQDIYSFLHFLLPTNTEPQRTVLFFCTGMKKSGPEGFSPGRTKPGKTPAENYSVTGMSLLTFFEPTSA